MLNKEKDLLLRNLIKIETGIAKIYNRLSIRDNFTPPVRKFWRSLALEEELHADMFDEIRQGMNNDGIPVSVNIKIEKLKEFVDRVNSLAKKTTSEEFSDSEAYSLGALIEMELDEAEFVKMIETIDQKFIKMLKKIQNDTKKHRVMLVNYSRGVK
jgi:rubrerythrin